MLAAQSVAPTPSSFPLVPVEEVSEKGLKLVVDPVAQRELQSAVEVIWSDVVVPTETGFDHVDLELRRVDVIPDHAQVFVDGQLAGGAAELRAGFSAWIGEVTGEHDSDVFLAVTSTGTHGWVKRLGGTAHYMATPAEGNDWSRGQSIVLHDTDPLLADGFEFTCSGPLYPPGYDEEPEQHGTHRAAGGGLLECFIAVETDYQYYQNFNNLTAAQDYMMALWSSISPRYETSANTKISIPYLGLYSTSNDPWSTPDNGGGAGDMLGEFRAAWVNNIPANANLAHFISGASLGGGVAYVDVLCNSTWGFAVSGNLAGNTPLPVTGNGPLNWDFVVVAHETGHNFGTGHTHNYCPTPLDQCAPSWAGFGACQTTQVCQQGTIMSYCHLCPGGINRIDPEFHPTVASVIASDAANSCLGPCQSCSTVEADFSANPTQGVAPLTVSFTDLTTGGTIDTWVWDFGDGTTSGQQNPNHIYNTPGSYTVSLTASGPSGLGIEIKTGLIEVEVAPAVSNIIPNTVDNLLPGTGQTVTIVGQGFLPDTVVQVDNVDITTESTVLSENQISFDMPDVSNGVHLISIVNANGTAGDFIDVVPPSGPVLQAGDGDPGADVFTAIGIPIEMAGPPFSIQLLVASPSDVPSVLPGKIDLDLGAAFTQTYNLGATLLDGNGRAAFTHPLSPPLAGTTLYLQSMQVEFPIPQAFPWDSSNLQEIFVWF